MAYSRWGESYWYTYWCVKLNGEVETRDNATFEVCPYIRFAAKELRDDLEGCVAKAVAACDSYTDKSLPLESEIDDLRDCMREFLEEVDERYPDNLAKLTQESQAMGLYDPPFTNPMIRASDEATETRSEE